jgi:hypothetical protein
MICETLEFFLFHSLITGQYPHLTDQARRNLHMAQHSSSIEQASYWIRASRWRYLEFARGKSRACREWTDLRAWNMEKIWKFTGAS